MRKGAKLGQHFLKARWAAHMIARESGSKKGEVVLEIGPGKGFLTKELLNTGAKVIAIEKDLSLVEKLNKTFAEEIENGQLVLIENDVRNIDIPRIMGAVSFDAVRERSERQMNRTRAYGERGRKDSDKEMRQTHGSYILAANIPYYITGEIIRTFLTTKSQPKRMTFLIQKEVAHRIAKSKKESILSLSVKAYGTPKYVKTVSRSCFSPAPKVDSAILSIENISQDFFVNVDEEKFFEVVKTGFASKRKLLANNLSLKYEKTQVAKIFSACVIPEKARAEDVPLEIWKCLAQKLFAKS
jgi:16S rRNA (adenine1518-N6/adenine1519-N6)-dimethyltransferase